MPSADLDLRMRRFETALDNPVPQGRPIVVRLDGRRFYWFTWMIYKKESPFDLRFRDLMATTAEHLLGRCQNALVAYCQGDEISLLIHPEDTSFGRNPRELLSVLAGEASAAFSVAVGHVQVFDARLSVLPGPAQVLDYFRWRMADARRSCLDGYIRWLLRRGRLPDQITSATIKAMTSADKQGLLADAGIDFDGLPSWQKRGIAVYWVEREQTFLHPFTEEMAVRRLPLPRIDEELPSGEGFARAINALLQGQPFPSRVQPLRLVGKEIDG